MDEIDILLAKKEDEQEVRIKKRNYISGLYTTHKSQAYRRGKEHTLSIEEFEGIISQPCHYCKKRKALSKPLLMLIPNPPDWFYWIGVDRKDNSKGYTIDDTVP